MILVTGATGPLGGGVVNHLLNKSAGPLAVLIRNADRAEEFTSRGVEVRLGDYNDYPSLVHAFAGVDKLYFVSGNDIPNRLTQQQNVVEAAREAGVGHVFYTSFQRDEEQEGSPIAQVEEVHRLTELWLKESGLTYTLLRHGLYMDLLPMQLGEDVLKNGTVYFPGGDARIAFTLREDLAEAGANLLTTSGHANRTYDLVNGVTAGYADVARLLGDLSGKSITYHSPSYEAYVETLTKAGVPGEYAALFGAFGLAFQEGAFSTAGNTLEAILGRKPADVKMYLTSVYANH